MVPKVPARVLDLTLFYYQRFCDLCVLPEGTSSSQLALLGITFTHTHTQKKKYMDFHKNVPSALFKPSIMYRLSDPYTGLCVPKTYDQGSFLNSSHIKISQHDQTCTRFTKTATALHLTSSAKVKAFYHHTTFLSSTIYTFISVHNVYTEIGINSFSLLFQKGQFFNLFFFSQHKSEVSCGLETALGYETLRD